MSRCGGFSSAPAGMYQSAGTSCPLAQSMRSVELRTVTVLFGGRIGGPPTTLMARPYRLKTIVPITLSTPRSGGADAVEVVSAPTGAANATAAVSVVAAAFRVAATTLRNVVSTAANGSTVVCVTAVDLVDSVGSVGSVRFRSSDSGLADGFTAGRCLTARGLADLAALVSAVSDAVVSPSLTVSGAGRWAGGSSAGVPSSLCLAVSMSSGFLRSTAVIFFGFLPEGFGLGAPVLSVPESALFSVG